MKPLDTNSTIVIIVKVGKGGLLFSFREVSGPETGFRKFLA